MLSSKKFQNHDDEQYSIDSTEDLNLPPTKIQRHPKSLKNCSYREKEIKVVRSIAKELSGKAFQTEFSKFQPSHGLLEKKVICSKDKVSLRFSSPLCNISSPHYIKKWKCEDMIAEEADDSSLDQKASVIAVKLNWRKGVKVEQVSKYSRQTKCVEPEMTTTDFDFESKLKFQKQLSSITSDLFPDKSIKVLDGNECHGLVTLKSKDMSDFDSNTETELLHPNTSIYSDSEEHAFLLVPIHSKVGFENDVSKCYSFPYHAKFTIGKKTFENQFHLGLVPSNSPQHFGLIFSFSLDGDQKVLIKSLLSVYSIFPLTTRHASLITYTTATPSTSRVDNSKSKGKSWNRQFVKNLKETVSSNLQEEKMVNGGAFGIWDREGEFSIGSKICHPNQRFLGLSKSHYAANNKKNKDKAQLTRNIMAEVCDN